MANKTGSSSGSDNGDSHNSSRSSNSEEEQLRRLFNSCDADGDGYLDGEDLRFMCRMLNMSDSVEEVRTQLGLTETSKISFQDFLHCRTRVMLQSATAASGQQAPHQLHSEQVGYASLMPQQYSPHPQHHNLGVPPSPPPPTVMMSGIGTNLNISPHRHQQLQQYPMVAVSIPFSLPSTSYPYPHQPLSNSTLPQCQQPCAQYSPQLQQFAAPHQRYLSPKVYGLMAGSGEDTGVESDATGGNITTGHQLTSWPTLSSDSLGFKSANPAGTSSNLLQSRVEFVQPSAANFMFHSPNAEKPS
ncbi:hypothetical protein PoB_005653200 [Plakobranchus ocellatus]|uniref:EF-hand domain-containing protein n=1 Tax=Plakobranchus ocellatus TaxID=259542 RepID=A0AAV4CEP1_9GAST|nr:hypothetical protein PoB_005653200 [Plakobranchus ocellatus]